MIKTSKSVIKVLAIILISLLILALTGCSSEVENVILEYDIITAQYTNNNGNERVDITYIDENGIYRNDYFDPDSSSFQVADENKVVITNPDKFWTFSKTYVMTAEEYNATVQASPEYYNIKMW